MAPQTEEDVDHAHAYIDIERIKMPKRGGELGFSKN
jgi:hypothetical protein